MAALHPGMARLHAARGAVEQALAACDRALTLDPQQPRYLLDKARLLYEQQQPQAAIVTLERALTLDARCGEAHRQLGQIYEALQQDDLALAAYRQAATCAPDDAAVKFDHARLCLKLGDV
jgi:tetratricopeptide (TPR) repeat protein